MLRKIFFFITTVFLAATLTTTAFPAQMPRDISGHWAENMIRLAVTMGLFDDEPYLLEQFEPNRHMTRVELCGVLNRLYDFTEEADVTFHDVISTSPYGVELRRAAKAGYIVGDDRGRANPEGFLTRAEAAAMIYRIEKYPQAPGESRKFIDYQDIPTWAAGAVDACVKKGIIKGDNESKFRPNDRLTRAEVVALMYSLAFN